MHLDDTTATFSTLLIPQFLTLWRRRVVPVVWLTASLGRQCTFYQVEKNLTIKRQKLHFQCGAIFDDLKSIFKI